MRKYHLEIAKKFWKIHLKGKGTVLDATCGNGKDTLFLAQEIFQNNDSQLIALDVQTPALQNTKKLLKLHLSKKNFQKVQLKKISHHLFIPEYPFDLIVYNLGYLPGGDKNFTTEYKTTFESVQKALHWLKPGGAISIICYPGHPSGLIEATQLAIWAKELDPKKYLTLQYRSLNRSQAPFFLWILTL